MSTQYKSSKEVPSTVLAARLEELSDVVCGHRGRMSAEFTMRVPAECDRDADLVMSEAARRLREASGVSGLVEALSDSIKGIEIPSYLTHKRSVEAFKAGARAAVIQMNAAIAAYRKQPFKSDSAEAEKERRLERDIASTIEKMMDLNAQKRALVGALELMVEAHAAGGWTSASVVAAESALAAYRKGGDV